MISEKQQDIITQGIIFHFLGSDRSKAEEIKAWVQTLDHSQASPIIGKLISLKHDTKISSEEWKAIEAEVRQDLISVGMPFIQ